MAKCRRCRADVEDEPEQWCEACEEHVHPKPRRVAPAKVKAAKPKAAAKVTDAELAAVVPNWQPQPLLSAPKPTLWQKMKALWQ